MKSIFISVFLIIVPIAVFCGLVARKLLDDFPHHSGWSIMGVVIALTLFVSYFFIRISYTTPLIDEVIVYINRPDDSPVTCIIFFFKFNFYASEV